MAVFGLLHSTQFHRKPTPKMIASANISIHPILWPLNPIQRRLTPGNLQWTREFRKSKYIPRLGCPLVTIPITMSSEISSITHGTPSIVPKTWNRPSDSLKPTIPSHKLIATSTKADARFPSTFPSPPDGQCTIKSKWWILSYRNGKKPPSPPHTVGGFSIFKTW